MRVYRPEAGADGPPGEMLAAPPSLTHGPFQVILALYSRPTADVPNTRTDCALPVCTQYWARPQFKTLISHTWDVVVIMLGTNDATPTCWPAARGCGTPANATTTDCQFADDLAALVDEARKHGPKPGTPPAIFLMSPPSLMHDNRNPMNLYSDSFRGAEHARSHAF